MNPFVHFCCQRRRVWRGHCEALERVNKNGIANPKKIQASAGSLRESFEERPFVEFGTHRSQNDNWKSWSSDQCWNSRNGYTLRNALATDEGHIRSIPSLVFSRRIKSTAIRKSGNNRS